MSILAFVFEPSPTSNDDQVRPEIDGFDVLRKLADDSLGMDPPEFFRQPALGIGGELLIGRCSCGVVGCGDVQVDVDEVNEIVTWRFRADQAYQFELQQYLESFRSAAASTAWESVGRTAERLVSSIDFGKFVQQGYQLDWASTRIARGRVTLSFSRQGTQRLFEIGWNDQDAEDAVERVRHWLADYR
jgi:hypothetical protein